jgi:hypothetical protein
MKTDPKKEYRYLSAWKGKTLEAKMNALSNAGFVIDWRYTNIKHCCWMSRLKEDSQNA